MITLKKQYKEALNYIRESKKYIYYSIVIFLISSLIGYIFSPYLSFIEEYIKKLIEPTLNLNALELIFYILQNNLQGALVSIIAGTIGGIVPILSAIGNGVIIGYVISLVAQTHGFLSIWRLFPHGIFELPAIFIALGLGTKLGFVIFFKGNKNKEFIRRFYNSINVLLIIIIPLLIIAAIIEGLLISLFS